MEAFPEYDLMKLYTILAAPSPTPAEAVVQADFAACQIAYDAKEPVPIRPREVAWTTSMAFEVDFAVGFVPQSVAEKKLGVDFSDAPDIKVVSVKGPKNETITGITCLKDCGWKHTVPDATNRNHSVDI
jgi:hypothetical protein